MDEERYEELYRMIINSNSELLLNSLKGYESLQRLNGKPVTDKEKERLIKITINSAIIQFQLLQEAHRDKKGK